MLDDTERPQQTRFETAFQKWWNTQPATIQDRMDYSVARLTFRSGYASGRKADLDRYVFRAGRFRITVWASGMLDAKQKAAEEADFRAARNGWKVPKGGWRLKEIRGDSE